MRNARVKLAIAAAVVGAPTVGAVALATGGRKISESLTGYEEVPALSTPGTGVLRAWVNRSGQEIRYRLSYDDLESPATQSHIHLENATNNGPIVAFCAPTSRTRRPGRPRPRAPLTAARSADRSARATWEAAPRLRGSAAGEFGELVDAIRAGATYVNVHTTGRPGGEIRAQLDLGKRH